MSLCMLFLVAHLTFAAGFAIGLASAHAVIVWQWERAYGPHQPDDLWRGRL